MELVRSWPRRDTDVLLLAGRVAGSHWAFPAVIFTVSGAGRLKINSFCHHLKHVVFSVPK